MSVTMSEMAQWDSVACHVFVHKAETNIERHRNETKE